MSLLCEDLSAVVKETCPGDAAWVGSDMEEFLIGGIPSDLMVVLFAPGGSGPARLPASECREIAAVTDAAVWRFPVKSSILGNSRRKAKLSNVVEALVSYSKEIA